MFSPDRYGSQPTSFGMSDALGGRNFIGFKTAFRTQDTRTPLQKAAHFRFSEPATPSVQKGRGWRPSDLSDPQKRQFLTELSGRVFHLAASGVDHGEEGERKISLERLFTPATDSGDLTPKRNAAKKAFASSAFYRPDHPTIDDQVELAQRISFSLVDENNKMSRGQSMYMKRKKRSMRWVHQGSGADGFEEESGPPQAPSARRPASVPPLHPEDTKKPPMKLLMNPKGVQDFHAVQEHYQALMDAVPTSPEVGKIVTEVQSPTGKGAELFAKRKKRMDKFIVDETTVQKAQQHTTTNNTTQQQTLNNSNAVDEFALRKSAVEERNRQQEQILSKVNKPVGGGQPQLANTVCERADTKLAEAATWLELPKPVPIDGPSLDGVETAAPGPLNPGTGAIYSAEVKVVQHASLPPTPAPEVPHYTLPSLDPAGSNKRNSLSFNMAAKGWGTYNKFYSPVTFAT